MIRLTDAQIDKLQPFVADYDYGSLRDILSAATGVNKINDIAAEALLPSARAKNALLDANDAGYIDVLLRTMLKRRDCKEAFRAAVLEIFPSLKSPDNPFQSIVEEVVRIIDDNRNRFDENARKNAAAFAIAIRQLARYRDVSECIMALSRACALELPGDEDGLGASGEDVDRAALSLRNAVNQMRAVFADPADAEPSRTAWIEGFETAIASLEAARKRDDAGVVFDIIDDLSAQATFALGYSNGVIAATWRMAPVASLVAALKDAAAPGGPIDVLTNTLKSVIDEYNSLQQIRRSLSRLDHCLKAPPRSAFVLFSGAWRQTRGRLEEIVKQPTGLPWLARAREAMDALDTALGQIANSAPNDNDLGYKKAVTLKGPLGDLQRHCNDRLLTVGLVLKSRLVETGALQNLLSVIGGSS